MCKAIYNADRSRRAVLRGRNWHVQMPSGQNSSKTHSGWYDIGKPIPDRAKAIAAIGAVR